MQWESTFISSYGKLYFGDQFFISCFFHALAIASFQAEFITWFWIWPCPCSGQWYTVGSISVSSEPRSLEAMCVSPALWPLCHHCRKSQRACCPRKMMTDTYKAQSHPYEPRVQWEAKPPEPTLRHIRINHFCFKHLNFGAVCYSTVANWYISILKIMKI